MCSNEAGRCSMIISVVVKGITWKINKSQLACHNSYISMSRLVTVNVLMFRKLFYFSFQIKSWLSAGNKLDADLIGQNNCPKGQKFCTK